MKIEFTDQEIRKLLFINYQISKKIIMTICPYTNKESGEFKWRSCKRQKKCVLKKLKVYLEESNIMKDWCFLIFHQDLLRDGKNKWRKVSYHTWKMMGQQIFDLLIASVGCDVQYIARQLKIEEREVNNIIEKLRRNEMVYELSYKRNNPDAYSRFDTKYWYISDGIKDKEKWIEKFEKLF